MFVLCGLNCCTYLKINPCCFSAQKPVCLCSHIFKKQGVFANPPVLIIFVTQVGKCVDMYTQMITEERGHSPNCLVCDRKDFRLIQNLTLAEAVEKQSLLEVAA